MKNSGTKKSKYFSEKMGQHFKKTEKKFYLIWYSRGPQNLTHKQLPKKFFLGVSFGRKNILHRASLFRRRHITTPSRLSMPKCQGQNASGKVQTQRAEAGLGYQIQRLKRITKILQNFPQWQLPKNFSTSKRRFKFQKIYFSIPQMVLEGLTCVPKQIAFDKT